VESDCCFYEVLVKIFDEVSKWLLYYQVIIRGYHCKKVGWTNLKARAWRDLDNAKWKPNCLNNNLEELGHERNFSAEKEKNCRSSEFRE